MGVTERRLISTKLSVLDRIPAKVLGAVLNGVHLNGEFQYYAYAPGYSIQSDSAPGKLASFAGR
jgi:hypothetical protein